MTTQTKMAQEAGLSVRSETIRLLTGANITNILKTLVEGSAWAQLEMALSISSAEAILRDLQNDHAWQEENWVLDDSQEVRAVGSEEFTQMSPTRRFSHNYCLRKPAVDAWCLRGFLSAITSREVRQAFSDVTGTKVGFKSADIACYGKGHYLRRHSDDFDARFFGFVWFLSPGWMDGMGGELVIENPSGACIIVRPQQASIASLAFRSDCFHQVAAVNDPTWKRYSIATHFSKIN